MARIRSIKPDFWTDEKTVELSPLARLLFIGMWNFVDDYGRAEYSPKRLKMQILPSDNTDMSKLIGEIRGKKLIEIYQVDNKEYFVVCNFVKHQKVDKRTPSKIPPPPNNSESPPNLPPDLEVFKDLGSGKEVNKKTMRDSDESLVSLRKWFEEVMWLVVPKKTGKELTWKQVKELKPDSDTRSRIVEYFKSYPSIAATYPPGEFFAPMQDPVRVIKNKRYLDELAPYQERHSGTNGGPRRKVYITRESYEAALKRGETNISLRLPEESNV